MIKDEKSTTTNWSAIQQTHLAVFGIYRDDVSGYDIKKKVKYIRDLIQGPVKISRALLASQYHLRLRQKKNLKTGEVEIIRKFLTTERNTSDSTTDVLYETLSEFDLRMRALMQNKGVSSEDALKITSDS